MKYNNVHILVDGSRLIFTDLTKDSTDYIDFGTPDNSLVAITAINRFVDILKSRKGKV